MTSIQTEQEFLHDIASPLSVAQGYLELLGSSFEPGRPITKVDLVRMGKLLKAIDKVVGCVKQRREILRALK